MQQSLTFQRWQAPCDVAGKCQEEIKTMKFNVPDMTCGHCVATVTRAVRAADPAADVKVDLAGKTVTVETAIPAAAVAKALDDAGYSNTAL